MCYKKYTQCNSRIIYQIYKKTRFQKKIENLKSRKKFFTPSNKRKKKNFNIYEYIKKQNRYFLTYRQNLLYLKIFQSIPKYT